MLNLFLQSYYPIYFKNDDTKVSLHYRRHIKQLVSSDFCAVLCKLYKFLELLLFVLLTKRFYSVDIVRHSGRCRTRIKVFCNIFVNSVVSLFVGDLGTKIFRSFIKTRNSSLLLLGFEYISAALLKPLCVCIGSLWSDVYLY
jgi:hypothetical protein